MERLHKINEKPSRYPAGAFCFGDILVVHLDIYLKWVIINLKSVGLLGEGMMQVADQNQFDEATNALLAIRMFANLFFAIRIFFIPVDALLGVALMTRFGVALANRLEISPSKIQMFAVVLLATAAGLLITGWLNIPF